MNGRRIDREAWPVSRVNHGDELVFVALPAGIETALLAAGLAPLLASALSVGINLALAVGAGFLAQKLLGAPTEADFGESPTYTWGNIQNTTRNGQAVPVVYGEHRIGGQILQVFTTTNEQGDTILRLLIGLGEGPLQSIATLTSDANGLTGASIPDGIKINGNEANILEGVKVSTRLGNADQTVIPGFRDVVTVFSLNLDLAFETEVTYTTSEAVDAFEVVLNFPNGLYKIDASDGDVDHESAFYRVRWRRSGDVAYQDDVEIEVRKRTTSPFDVVYRNENPFNVFGDEVIVEIAVTRTSGNDDDRHKKEFDWKGVNEIDVTQGIHYQHTALLALEIPAQEQVSGSIPHVTTAVQGKKVFVWDGVDPDPETATFTFQFSTNPAWCCYDLISNARYGGGDRFNGCSFDLQAWKDWADYCDETISDSAGSTMKRWELGLVLDTAEPFWDQVLRIAAAGRATILKDGNVLRPKIERAASPVQLFSMGNIDRDSLVIQYASNQDRANLVEVQYLDAANDYEQSIAAREDETALESAGDPVRKDTVQLFGITKNARAYRAAQYLLNINSKWRKSIKFRAQVDAVAAEPGDVFSISHDLPYWNQISGRIHTTSATSTRLVIDRDLTIATGEVWKATVRTTGTGVDVLQERTIISSPGTYVAGSSLVVSVAWNGGDLPQKYDVYAVGNTAVQTHVKSYRMVSSSLSADLMREIEAIEYDATVYEDDPGLIIEDPSDPPITPDTIPPDPTNLSLIEGAGPSIHVSWVAAPWPFTYPFWVYLRNETDGATEFVFVGETFESSFIITEGVFLGNLYSVCVIPVAPNGQHGPPEDGLCGTILITGNTGFPDPVTNLACSQQGRNVTLQWTGVDPETNSLSHYEVRRGLEWIHGHQIGTTTATIFTTTDWPVGSERFWVRSVSVTGKLDINPASIACTLVNPPPEVAVINRDEVALGWPGTKTGTVVDTDGALILDTGQTTGTYESPAIDGATVTIFRSGILIGSRQEDLATTWDSGALTWDSATFTWDSSTALSTTWDSSSLTWDSVDAKIRDWCGLYYTPNTTQAIEWSFSDDNVTYSAYSPAIPGDYSCRYLKFRITLTRTSATDFQARVSVLLTTGSHATNAPADASYVVLGLNATLTDERVLTAGSGISIVDGGAGGTVTISATGAALIVQEDDVTVDAAAATIDFTEPLATIVSSSPAGEANVNLAAYVLASGARAMAGNLDLGTNLVLNIGATGTDFTAGGGLTLASTLTLTGFTTGSILFVGASAAVAEDAANLYWDDSNNRLSLGGQENTVTINGGVLANLFSVHSETSDVHIGLHHHNDSNVAGRLMFIRSRGTEALESAVASGDILGQIDFAGRDNADYALGAQIKAIVSATPAAGDMPTDLVFYVSADGSETPTERMRIAQTGLVSIGTGGTFTLASGANDLAVNGDLEVEGQTRLEGTVGWQTAPATATMWAATFSSATVVNGFDVAITATPGAGTLAATVLDFTLNDIATDPGALITVTGANFTIRYNRDVADQPSSYNLRAINIANYGVQSGTTINAGTFNYRGIKVNRNNAGANVSGGTHTFIDFESDSDATGYPGGTRQYAAKFSSDVWIIDSEPFFFGTGEDCDITYDGTNWLFNVNNATTAIVFNEGSVDCDFRVESNGNANGLFIDAGNDRVGIMTATTFATLSVNGGIGGNVRTITGTSNQLTGADWLVIMDTSGGNVTCNLPPAANKGQMITIKRSSASNVATITCDAGDNIQDDADDSVTLTATIYQGRTYIADGGTRWYRIDAQTAA